MPEPEQIFEKWLTRHFSKEAELAEDLAKDAPKKESKDKKKDKGSEKKAAVEELKGLLGSSEAETVSKLDKLLNRE